MVQQIIYFSAVDANKLGDIAETARGFIHHNPSRGDYDAWKSVFLSIEPMIEDLPEGLPFHNYYDRPTFKEEYRKEGKIYEEPLTTEDITYPLKKNAELHPTTV